MTTCSTCCNHHHRTWSAAPCCNSSRLKLSRYRNILYRIKASLQAIMMLQRKITSATVARRAFSSPLLKSSRHVAVRALPVSEVAQQLVPTAEPCTWQKQLLMLLLPAMLHLHSHVATCKLTMKCLLHLSVCSVHIGSSRWHSCCFDTSS